MVQQNEDQLAIVGGYNSYGSSQTSIVVYDPKTKTLKTDKSDKLPYWQNCTDNQPFLVPGGQHFGLSKERIKNKLYYKVVSWVRNGLIDLGAQALIAKNDM